MISSAALMLALTIAGCDKNEEPKVPANPETPGTPTAPADRPIIFTTAIAATRSPQLEADGSGTFTAGDTFTLYAHDGNGASAALDYTIGATALYWREIAFAQEGERINLAACYPKQTLDKGAFDFTVTQSPDRDLLLVTGKEAAVGSEQPVELTFRHAMHRLTVQVEIEDESADAASVEILCSAHASGRFDLATGTCSLHDSKETFSVTKPEGNFLLYPQPTGGVSLEVHAGEATKQWTLSELAPKQDELESGKELTVKLTVRDGKILFAGMTIEGWGNQGTVDGEIIL